MGDITTPWRIPVTPLKQSNIVDPHLTWIIGPSNYSSEYICKPATQKMIEITY